MEGRHAVPVFLGRGVHLVVVDDAVSVHVKPVFIGVLGTLAGVQRIKAWAPEDHVHRVVPAGLQAHPCLKTVRQPVAVRVGHAGVEVTSLPVFIEQPRQSPRETRVSAVGRIRPAVLFRGVEAVTIKIVFGVTGVVAVKARNDDHAAVRGAPVYPIFEQVFMHVRNQIAVAVGNRRRFTGRLVWVV